ncbi:phosphodiester glycosidase family protein [Parenemella sanctibonifatiensis]|uniref:Metallophosphoesterase n=1 Tax=Parenemella sanctibonifatiensis TaxID=2016505 RepID=A0A255EAK0_9ACTN|nr:phosphodiester glycosidase family protein [Parenemella sanctibonifatiensis]OYN88597.1 metallophosphoesterase [Parenemella sanctibonifatiensis]
MSLTVPRHGVRRWLATVTGFALAAGVVAVGVAPQAPAYAQADQGVTQSLRSEDAALVDSHTSELAPGVNLTRFERRQDRAWVGGNVLELDLTAGNLSIDMVDGDSVAGDNRTVSDFIEGQDDVVAAVNGDFFDMNATDAPIHTNYADGEMRSFRDGSLAFTMADGVAAIERLMTQSAIAGPAGSVDIKGVNTPDVTNGVTVFNQAWGSYPLDGLLAGAPVRILTIEDGRVASVSTDPASVSGSVDLSPGRMIVVARGSQWGSSLDGFQVGDEVSIDLQASSSPDTAVGGNWQLVTNGELTDTEQVTAGRTAVGISRDGTRLYIVTVDGRRADANGMTVQELARLMRDLGAWNALNLDGGGSTTMVGRPAGSEDPVVLNQPSDGGQRVVSNALVIRSSATTELSGAHLAVAGADPTTPEAGLLETFPGLSRTVQGSGLDGAGRPVTSFGSFSSGDHVSLTAVGDRAKVTGGGIGSGQIEYAVDGHVDSIDYRVHGDLQRLQPNRSLVALSAVDQTSTLRLEGVDGDGNTAPIEYSDVTVETSGPISVRPNSLTSFEVSGTASGSGVITLSVGDHSVQVAVTVGTVDAVVSDFSDIGQWRFTAARATGEVHATEGPEGGPALGMTYDFTTSTATRGGYAVAAQPIAVEGQPQSLSLWIKGDESGVWPRIQIGRGDGTTTNVDGPNVTWQGWRQVSFPIPAGTAYPIEVQQLRFMETRSTVSYHGDVAIADLAAQVPADVELPQTPYVHDPVIVANGSVADRPTRIAVMSDAQFVGRNPDSALVASARRTLQEIRAAQPDLLVINGDLVDEASDADFELAKRILDEELEGSVPFIYVPGNHELMGAGIDNFEKHFGDSRTATTVNGTRIITLDSSTGNLHPGGIDQLAFLEEELAAAQADDAITGVVVFNHHPIDDPTPQKASQLGDRTEAAALDRVFAEFRAGGKQIAHINGHVGLFHATARDGVSRVVNGNSGKAPAAGADQGGFVGWTMLGIDPARGVVDTDPQIVADRIGWLRAETKPQTDEVRLTAELDGNQDAEMVDGRLVIAEGGQVDLSAVLSQGSIEVPVQWPVSAQWAGNGVLVAAEDVLGEQQLLAAQALPEGYRFDPATGVLAWNGGGQAELTVTVNGVEATLLIGPAQVDPTPTPTPSPTPTPDPTGTPTQDPTGTPTQEPTVTPTQEPTVTPTQEPTGEPTGTPTPTPTEQPTGTPTSDPTGPADPTGTPGDSAGPTGSSTPTGDDDKPGMLPDTGAGAAGVVLAGLGAAAASVMVLRRRS